MSLAGAASSMNILLRSEYERRFGALNAPTFEVTAPQKLADELINRVTVFVFRVEQDPTRRHDDRPPARAGQARRSSLVLDAHVLLTAWMKDPEGELLVLGRCMEILDQHPILSGPRLDPTYGPWDPDTQIRITMEHQSAEDSFRLWDALTPSYRLSIPYVLRTIRLMPTLVDEGVAVDASTRVFVPAVTEDER